MYMKIRERVAPQIQRQQRSSEVHVQQRTARSGAERVLFQYSGYRGCHCRTYGLLRSVIFFNTACRDRPGGGRESLPTARRPGRTRQGGGGTAATNLGSPTGLPGTPAPMACGRTPLLKAPAWQNYKVLARY